MFRDGEVIFNIVLGLGIFAAIIFFGIKGCDEKPQTKESETREMKAGTPDTITIRHTDTLWVEKRTRDVVYVPVEKIIKFGKDSSKTDTTINLDNGKLILGLTTYPAIESLKLDIDLLTVDREIFRTDTIKVTRIDTLNITKEIYNEPAWYETWWFGSIITTAVGITAIILGK